MRPEHPWDRIEEGRSPQGEVWTFIGAYVAACVLGSVACAYFLRWIL